MLVIMTSFINAVSPRTSYLSPASIHRSTESDGNERTDQSSLQCVKNAGVALQDDPGGHGETDPGRTANAPGRQEQKSSGEAVKQQGNGFCP